MRARIRDRHNVVRTVAIVAFGGLGVPKLRNFPMIRVKVSLRNFLMASAALIHDGKLETFAVGASDRVRAVAVIADR